MKILTGLVGITGRMGQEIKKASENSHFEIIGGISSSSKENFDNLFKNSQIVIDFSSKDVLQDLLLYALKYKTPLVIGTTGYSTEDLQRIEEASKKIPIFYSSNFSIGVALLRSFCKKASEFFCDSYVDIIEKHHIHKKDKPSGTALSIEKDLKKNLKKEIGIHCIRAANIVGEHTVSFRKDDELFEIKHSALSRSILAKGALDAAEFIYNKKSGLYSMQDLLGDFYAKS
ncbi:MAG: 4-hydroxy-tetrahydrodipicolinate reductase [Parachlamydiales bacterium]|jgi:4-hydroxy-tetrahydrodipicolinate reductase